MADGVQGINQDNSGQSDPYFFAIYGVREPYSNWKRFKDLVRSLIPSNSPGWTCTGPSTPPGVDHWAYFSVKTWADAQAAYAGLIALRQKDGSHMTIHVLDTTGRTGQQYKLMCCNCYALGLAGPDGCAWYPQNGWTPAPTSPALISPLCNGLHIQTAQVAQYIPPIATGRSGPAAQLIYPAYSYPVPQAVMAGPLVGYGFAGPAGWSLQQIQAQQQMAPPASRQHSSPDHSRSSNGLPVDTSRGAYITESRSILITNLNFRTREVDLSNLIARVVRPTRIDLTPDPNGRNNNKGSAIVHFETAADAQKCISRLNNTKLAGKNLHMRPDRNATATHQTRPSRDWAVIIDSSASSRRPSMSHASEGGAPL